MKNTVADEVNEYLNALGTLVIVYSDLENWLKIYSNILVNPKGKTGEILTCDLSARQLLNKFSSLYLFHNTDIDTVTKFRQLVNEIDSCITERNALIHSVWHLLPIYFKSDPLRMKAKSSVKGYVVDQKSVPVSEIKKLIDRIDRASKEILQLIIEWRRVHPQHHPPPSNDEASRGPV